MSITKTNVVFVRSWVERREHVCDQRAWAQVSVWHIHTHTHTPVSGLILSSSSTMPCPCFSVHFFIGDPPPIFWYCFSIRGVRRLAIHGASRLQENYKWCSRAVWELNGWSTSHTKRDRTSRKTDKCIYIYIYIYMACSDYCMPLTITWR